LPWQTIHEKYPWNLPEEISLESPGRLRNLTSVNTPAMEKALAISLPTSMITMDTMAGRITRVIAKFVEKRFLRFVKI